MILTHWTLIFNFLNLMDLEGKIGFQILKLTDFFKNNKLSSKLIGENIHSDGCSYLLLFLYLLSLFMFTCSLLFLLYHSYHILHTDLLQLSVLSRPLFFNKQIIFALIFFLLTWQKKRKTRPLFSFLIPYKAVF